MVDDEARTIHGVIRSAQVEEVRTRGLFRHCYRIGGHEYRLIAHTPVLQAGPGDTVALRWRPYKTRGRTYRNIVRLSFYITVTRDMEKNVDGYIYMLRNEAMPGLLKIGYTETTPEERRRTLSRVTGVPQAFELAWSAPIVGDPRAVEQAVHRRLSGFSAGKEFFRLDEEMAVETIQGVIEEMYPEQAHCEPDLEARRRAYEELRKRYESERETRRRLVQERMEELARQMERLKPPADWNLTPVTIEGWGVRLRISDDPLTTSHPLATDVMNGRADVTEHQGWTIELWWRHWFKWRSASPA